MKAQKGWERVALPWVVFFTVVVLGVFLVAAGSPLDAKNLGPVGDWFGGMLNPMIAFLALMGLVKSVALQRETLRQTVDGLGKQLAVQQRQLSRQTFFDLLTLRAEAVNSIQWASGPERFKGRAAINALLTNLDETAKTINPADIENDLKRWEVPLQCPDKSKPHVAVFATFYSGEANSYVMGWHRSILNQESQWANLEAVLGHVFRATYQVLKFVYECSDFSSTEKKNLVNYLRAQMSEGEFALFALTALTSIGRKSRAASIAFNLYEDRLYSIPWATGLIPLFDREVQDNRALATRLGYAPLAEN